MNLEDIHNETWERFPGMNWSLEPAVPARARDQLRFFFIHYSILLVAHSKMGHEQGTFFGNRAQWTPFLAAFRCLIQAKMYPAFLPLTLVGQAGVYRAKIDFAALVEAWEDEAHRAYLAMDKKYWDQSWIPQTVPASAPGPPRWLRSFRAPSLWETRDQILASGLPAQVRMERLVKGLIGALPPGEWRFENWAAFNHHYAQRPPDISIEDWYYFFNEPYESSLLALRPSGGHDILRGTWDQWKTFFCYLLMLCANGLKPHFTFHQMGGSGQEVFASCDIQRQTAEWAELHQEKLDHLELEGDGLQEVWHFREYTVPNLKCMVQVQYDLYFKTLMFTFPGRPGRTLLDHANLYYTRTMDFVEVALLLPFVRMMHRLLADKMSWTASTAWATEGVWTQAAIIYSMSGRCLPMFARERAVLYDLLAQSPRMTPVLGPADAARQEMGWILIFS